jgi:hypothetical protein
MSRFLSPIVIRSSLGILRLFAYDAHLGTKRSYGLVEKGEQSIGLSSTEIQKAGHGEVKSSVAKLQFETSEIIFSNL